MPCIFNEYVNQHYLSLMIKGIFLKKMKVNRGIDIRSGRKIEKNRHVKYKI